MTEQPIDLRPGAVGDEMARKLAVAAQACAHAAGGLRAADRAWPRHEASLAALSGIAGSPERHR